MHTTGPGRDEAEDAGADRGPRVSARPDPESNAVVLAAQPASVSAARRFVRRTLASAAVDPAVEEDAALVVTELVSNAILHAGGPITLAASVVGSTVRIDVTDNSPVPPVLREYGSVASTGRGLTLVARLAERWGVEVAEPGKRVWAELAIGGVDVALTPPETTLVEGPTPVDDAVAVRFEGVPVPVYLRLQEQNDAVLRELELLAFTADHAGHLDPSPELVDVIERSRRYFNSTREGFRGVVAAAAERGETRIDLEGSASIAGLVPAADLVSLFEQAEELARHGELLIGPADSDVAQLRRWFVAELTAQLLDNRPPEPYSS